jgi:two-component system sensor histidine kinase TctE
VQGDRALIEAALRNLIDNAIKYSPPETTVDLALVNGASARIEVADRGRGLSGQEQTRLTKRFARGENARDVIGSGLGLTIVAEVAAAHGGRFELTDREGGGTCARLYLPLA